MSLSVVILTKNEAKNIRDCIASVSGWADDILVIDDESSDGTIGLAKEFGARVISRKMDIEGRHRNFAYSQAKNSWVFSLDADERLTPELRNEITEVLKDPGLYNGFTVPRRNYVGDYWVRYGGWYPSPQLKLFRKDKFRYEEVAVHPRAFMDEPCGHLKGDLIHYSYRSLEDFLNKLNNQTTREAEKWFNQHKPMRLGRFLWRSLDRFMRTYVGRQGYKEGFMGFVIAYFAALYQFVSYLKYRELARAKSQGAKQT